MPSINIPSRLKKKVASIDFQRIAGAVLQQTVADSKNLDYTIAIAGNARVKSLNEKYRGINSLTDVLSFPAGDEDPETGMTYLGDVVISLTEAEKQAELGGHPLETEITILVVHGLLHLVGFDHLEENEKQAMWKKQSFILESLGISTVIP